MLNYSLSIISPLPRKGINPCHQHSHLGKLPCLKHIIIATKFERNFELQHAQNEGLFPNAGKAGHGDSTAISRSVGRNTNGFKKRAHTSPGAQGSLKEDAQAHARVINPLAPRRAYAEPICPRISNVMRLTCAGLPVASEHMTLRTLTGKGFVCVDTGVFTTVVAQQAVICSCKTKAK